MIKHKDGKKTGLNDSQPKSIMDTSNFESGHVILSTFKDTFSTFQATKDFVFCC